MGEHAQRTIGTQPQRQVGRMSGKHQVDPRVLGQHLLGLSEHGIRPRGQRGQRPPHTPGQIHRSGPGRCDPGGFRRRRVGVADVRVCRQRHTERAGHPECRRTPDGQGLDRVDDLVDGGDPQPAQLARQQALVNGQQRAVVPGDRAFRHCLGSRLQCCHTSHPTASPSPRPEFLTGQPGRSGRQ